MKNIIYFFICNAKDGYLRVTQVWFLDLQWKGQICTLLFCQNKATVRYPSMDLSQLFNRVIIWQLPIFAFQTFLYIFVYLKIPSICPKQKCQFVLILIVRYLLLSNISHYVPSFGHVCLWKHSSRPLLSYPSPNSFFEILQITYFCAELLIWCRRVCCDIIHISNKGLAHSNCIATC